MDEKTTQAVTLELFSYLRNVWRRFKKLWILLLIIPVLTGLNSYRKCEVSYSPMYRTRSVLAVSVAEAGTDTYSTNDADYNYYYNSSAAAAAADAFPYLLDTEYMRELLKEELGGTVSGSISATSVPGTNFFVLTVTGSDPQGIYDTLQAVIRIFPQVSSRVIGATQLRISREAEVPTEPYNSSATSWKRATLKGVCKGVLISAALLAVVSLFGIRIVTENEIKSVCNLPMLTSVPVLRKRRSKKQKGALLLSSQKAESAYTESFRRLRLKVSRELDSSGGQVILVTSTLPAEGKSSVAANLALSLATGEKKVILVDADLRASHMREMFGIETREGDSGSGLGAMLRGDGQIRIVRIPDTTLRVMTDTETIPDPGALLKREKIGPVIRGLKNEFDYIVIDTPPCGSMADAAILSRFADKVIYVVREERVTRSQLQAGLQKLSGNGAKLYGIVMNCVSGSSASHSGYGYHYGYGYNYGKYGRYGKYGKYGSAAKK